MPPPLRKHHRPFFLGTRTAQLSTAQQTRPRHLGPGLRLADTGVDIDKPRPRLGREEAPPLGRQDLILPLVAHNTVPEPAEGQTTAGARGRHGSEAARAPRVAPHIFSRSPGPSHPASLMDSCPPLPLHPHSHSRPPTSPSPAPTPTVAHGQPPCLHIPPLQPCSHQGQMSKMKIQPANGSVPLQHQPLTCQKKCGCHMWQTRCQVLGTQWQSRQTRPLSSGELPGQHRIQRSQSTDRRAREPPAGTCRYRLLWKHKRGHLTRSGGIRPPVNIP